METIKIRNKSRKIEFGVDKWKFIIGNSELVKHDIIQSFKKCFYKVEASEYEKEESQIIDLTINNKTVDLKKNQLMIVSSQFDLDNDLKLGSKSIGLKFIEAILDKIEYNDLVNTINQLNKDLSIELSNLIEEETGYQFDLSINELNQKTLIKNLEIKHLKDDLIRNQYDLSYEEIISIQLKMIDKIAHTNYANIYWVILEVPLINKSIMQLINNANSNCRFIIVVNRVEESIRIENVLYCSLNNIYDFSDELIIYNDILLNLPFHTEIEELKEMIYKSVNNIDDNIIKTFNKII